MAGKSTEVVDTNTGEIVERPNFVTDPMNNLPGRIDDDLKFEINSLADYERLTGQSVVDLGDVLPSFDVLSKEEKARLVDRDLFLMEWRFNDSDKVIKDGEAAQFVSVLVLDIASGEKYVINDGSTGIYSQLRAVSQRTGRRGGFRVKNGLHRSDYTKTVNIDGKDQVIAATTYYLQP